MRFLKYFFLLSAGYLHAQPQTYIGVVGGAHAASSYIEHTLYTINLNSAIIPGFHGGVMFKYFNEYNPNFKLNTGLQGGIIYSRMGWKQVFELHPVLTTTMNYMMVPLDAIIYAGKGENRIFILLGIFGDYLLSSNSPDPPDPELMLEFEDFYTFSEVRDNKLGYGFNAGIGFQKDFPFGSFQLNGFFNYALSNIIKNEKRSDKTPDVSNLFNGGISLGYFIRLN